MTISFYLSTVIVMMTLFKEGYRDNDSSIQGYSDHRIHLNKVNMTMISCIQDCIHYNFI